MSQTLEKELDQLHHEERHEEIIERISQIPSDEISTQILGKLARANSNLGHFQEAIDILKGMEKEEEQSSLWNYRMGYQYFSLEEYEEAQKYLEKSFEINREEPEVTFLLCYTYECLAEKAQKENDMEKVIEYCEKIRFYAEHEKNTEELIWVESRLSWIYNRKAEFEEAKKHLEALMGLVEAPNAWIYGELGYNARGLFQNEEAIQCYHKAMECHKDEGVETGAFIYGELGWSYACNGESEKGIEYLSKGAELDPEDGWIASRLGYALGRVGHIQEGIEKLKESIELEGVNKVLIYSELGWLCNEANLYKEGLQYLLESEKLGRQDEWLNTEIGQCLGRLGRHEEGIERLKNSLNMEEDSTTDLTFIHSEIGWLYGKMDRHEDALTHLERARELGREDAWIYSEIAYNLSMFDEKLEEALKYFQKAQELGREDAWLYGQVGHLFSRMGRTEGAVQSLKLARNYTPYDSWILYHLGKNLRLLGEIHEAIEVLQQEIEISQFKGWGDLELAWAYALIDEKEKAEAALKNVEEYLSSQFETDEDLKQEYNSVKELLSMPVYLA